MATIPEFFAGQNVFLTGVSGFVGKVLVEKILRSCPEIEAIYVLLRDKHETKAHDRLNAILAKKLFDNIRQNNPEYLLKVRLISGDLLEKNFILDENDVDTLREKVNVVIHAAASVRFSEPLSISVELNLTATRKVLELAKTFRNLRSFVHVSTAYSNCQLKQVKEKAYACKLSPSCVTLLSKMTLDDKVLEHISSQLMEGRPNTYTFTKALAENLVEEYSAHLPIAIVRPSIITGARLEPLPGWVDNVNGPNGLLIALGTGVLTTLYIQLDCTADLIPVDFVANTILAAAQRAPHGFKIYNCTSGAQNPVTWRNFVKQSIDFPHRYPTTALVRYPQPRITSYKPLHQARLFLQHYVPVQVIDFALRCLGKKPYLSRQYKRLANSMGLLEFFTTNEWDFVNTNTQELFEDLHPSDKKQFNFDVRTIDWNAYVQDYCFGIRKFILNEDLSTLDRARSLLRRLKYVGYVTKIVLAIGACEVCSVMLSGWSTLYRIFTN